MQNLLKQFAGRDFASFEKRFTRSLSLLTFFYALTLGIILLISASITYSSFSSRLGARFNRVPPQVLQGQGIQGHSLGQDMRSSQVSTMLQELRNIEDVKDIAEMKDPVQIKVALAAMRHGPTAEDVRQDLIASLIFVNSILFLIAIGASYALARFTLRPLKLAYEEQRRFIADASHELRTPLAIMHMELENELGDVDTAIADLHTAGLVGSHSDAHAASSETNLAQTETHAALGAALKEDKENIKSRLEEIDRMTKIVQDLLLLSKLEGQHGAVGVGGTIGAVMNSGISGVGGKAHVTPMNISNVVHDIIKRLQTLAISHDVVLKFNEPVDLVNNPEGILIKGNEQVSHVLMNIIQNAVIYNKPKGTVDIDVMVGKRNVIVTVKDTGIGIGKADLEHIFERFYRVDKSRSRSTGGSGLGLAIAERGVESIGGSIHVNSELGKGTTMEVVFLKA